MGEERTTTSLAAGSGPHVPTYESLIKGAASMSRESPKPQTPRSAKKRGATAKDAAELPAARARRLFKESGLAVPLGLQQTSNFESAATNLQRDAVANLESALASHCEDAADADRLATALEWFKDFRTATGIVPFVDPATHAGKIYNQRTLELFAEYIRASGSRQRGRAGQLVSSDTIGSYVSAIKTATSRAQRQQITTPEHNILLPLLLKQMRREQPPDGSDASRALKLGFRARHLRQIAEQGFDRSSRRGVELWAAATLAHNLLLRGGELGRSSKRAWDHTRGLTLASFVFCEPCAESAWCAWLLAIIVAIKDTFARHKPMRIPIRRRATWEAQPELGADPLDTYDAVLLAWRERAKEVSPHDYDTAPFFTTADNSSAWTTEDSKNLARSMGLRLGMEPRHLGGKSFRIGGATDMREALGEGSKETIKQRGRWATDVAEVYQRALIKSHLDASVAMGSAQASRDLEEFCNGSWAQPALR